MEVLIFESIISHSFLFFLYFSFISHAPRTQLNEIWKESILTVFNEFLWVGEKTGAGGSEYSESILRGMPGLRLTLVPSSWGSWTAPSPRAMPWTTKQDEVFSASTEWRIQKYHGRTHRQTDRVTSWAYQYAIARILDIQIQSVKERPNVGLSYNTANFTLNKEDHTLGNMIRHQLMKDPNVIFAGYKNPSPFVNQVIIRVQTTSDYTPNDAFMNALTDLMSELSLFE